jgi:hypothetical protein
MTMTPKAFFQNENGFPILERFRLDFFNLKKTFSFADGAFRAKALFSKRVGIIFAQGRHHGSYPL